MPLIQIEHLTKKFIENDSDVHALSDVSFQIEEGEFAALCGPSGSGKTTLLNLIGCLDRPTSGKLWIAGSDITGFSQTQLTQYRLHQIGFIFQDFNLIPTLSAAENIEYVLWLQGVRSADRSKRSAEIAKRFSIHHLLSRRPRQLSRGQQQRVAVARAIAHKPKIVLGDELTANLDQKTGAELMDFLKELNQQERMTFIYATHDPMMMERAARVIKMKDGKVESLFSKEQVSHEIK